MKNTKEVILESLSKAISYDEYIALVAELSEKGKSTGPIETEELANYTLLNNRRMKRWGKTLKFTEETLQGISSINQKMTWLVITESWCGDAAIALPVIHKIAALNANISLKIVLRDENIALMNLFLTNEAMSIPKLIAVDDASGEVVSNWGPRSEAATALVEAYKKEHSQLTPEFKEELQVWYNKDKGQNIVKDLLGKFLLK